MSKDRNIYTFMYMRLNFIETNVYIQKDTYITTILQKKTYVSAYTFSVIKSIVNVHLSILSRYLCVKICV